MQCVKVQRIYRGVCFCVLAQEQVVFCEHAHLLAKCPAQSIRSSQPIQSIHQTQIECTHRRRWCVRKCSDRKRTHRRARLHKWRCKYWYFPITCFAQSLVMGTQRSSNESAARNLTHTTLALHTQIAQTLRLCLSDTQSDINTAIIWPYVIRKKCSTHQTPTLLDWYCETGRITYISAHSVRAL